MLKCTSTNRGKRVCGIVYLDWLWYVCPMKAEQSNISRCPWSGRCTHTGISPEVLKSRAVSHIEQQIAAYRLPSLPLLGIAKKLFRCRDCSGGLGS